MRETRNKKFQIKIDKCYKGWWSFGICFSHAWEETYLFINLFKWSISIGWLVSYEISLEPYKGGGVDG